MGGRGELPPRAMQESSISSGTGTGNVAYGAAFMIHAGRTLLFPAARDSLMRCALSPLVVTQWPLFFPLIRRSPGDRGRSVTRHCKRQIERTRARARVDAAQR